ncbi:MAG: circadian clock protein KaiC [Candidatus Thermoplasmatota archaeon]|nr:circadian clock protein KaiC [Candidatus Thermoplasmatota archaeon]
MDGVEDIPREPTGVPGFDLLLGGGLPKGRSVLVTGTAGSGKTVLAAQFIAEGIRAHDAPGVFVTLEETPEAIITNTKGLGFGVDELIEQGQLRFVDASLASTGPEMVVGEYELDPLLHRIDHAVQATGAKRVAIDAVNMLFDRYQDAAQVRQILFRISQFFKDRKITSLLTTQRVDESGPISLHGVEEFVADGVLVLRNELAMENRRRTVEVLKLRGGHHIAGQHPFTILPQQGIRVLPMTAARLDAPSSETRMTSGTSDLDAMLGGGLLKGSIVLVTGPTGAGKTVMSTIFATGLGEDEARCTYFTFEESVSQLSRNARSYGVDLEGAMDAGRLRIQASYPESKSLDQHFLELQASIEQEQPDRIVIDSLSALDKVAPERTFREFIIGLTDLIKRNGITAFVTSSGPLFQGAGDSITRQHISTLTDVVIVLRVVERAGRTEHAMSVLKMRGSPHDRAIRRFTISEDGVDLHETYHGLTGILRGMATPLADHGEDGREPQLRDRPIDPR